MKTSNGILAFSAALIMTMVNVGILSLIPGSNLVMYLLVGLSSFLLTYSIFYFIQKNIINTEIQKILKKINALDHKNFNIKSKKVLNNNNPVQKLNKEIDTFIETKQQEIFTLTQLEKYRKEFIANIAHELKTPIFTAQSYLETVIDSDLDKNKQTEFLQKASSSIDQLESLVTNILDLSKSESGKSTINISSINLETAINDVFVELNQIAVNKQVTLQKHINSIFNVNVLVDYQSLKQILINLIENAIKYGKISGTVLIKTKQKSEDLIEISIIDDGPGIATSDKEKIFERFFRLEKSRAKATGGSGLGLAIVKQLLLLHGNNIKVKSQVGKGTRFIFDLNLAKN